MDAINKLMSKRETFIITGSLVALEVKKQFTTSRKFLTVSFKRGHQNAVSIGPINNNDYAGVTDETKRNLAKYDEI